MLPLPTLSFPGALPWGKRNETDAMQREEIKWP